MSNPETGPGPVHPCSTSTRTLTRSAKPYPVGRGHRDAFALLRHSRATVAVVSDAGVLESIRSELPDLR
jgi:hypothetical protein